MAAAYRKPGRLAGGGQPEDRNLDLVERFGGTTKASAQVRALDRLRLEATFRTEGCIEQLIAQLRLGFSIPATRQVIMPDPCGWMVEGVGSGGLPY